MKHSSSDGRVGEARSEGSKFKSPWIMKDVLPSLSHIVAYIPAINTHIFVKIFLEWVGCSWQTNLLVLVAGLLTD